MTVKTTPFEVDNSVVVYEAGAVVTVLPVESVVVILRGVVRVVWTAVEGATSTVEVLPDQRELEIIGVRGEESGGRPNGVM